MSLKSVQAQMLDLAEEVDRLRARCARLEGALGAIDMTLRVPAAEYVPAIRDVFTIIDKAKA